MINTINDIKNGIDYYKELFYCNGQINYDDIKQILMKIDMLFEQIRRIFVDDEDAKIFVGMMDECSDLIIDALENNDDLMMLDVLSENVSNILEIILNILEE